MLNSLLKIIHEPIYLHRLRVLVRLMQPAIRAGDRILDIGCGSGRLAEAILGDPGSPPGISCIGVEKFRRGGEPIEVVAYTGGPLPFKDGSFDVVILADVLHHEGDQDQLLGEAARVSRRLVIVKDHKLDGPFAKFRVSFLDWAANEPHGVRCLYRYFSGKEWRAKLEHHGLQILHEDTDIDLYPPVFNFVFGRRLQYLACGLKSASEDNASIVAPLPNGVRAETLR